MSADAPLRPDLPLFPLRSVLFPGGVLPLKIFETRYLDMAARCLKDGSPFGVCLIRDGQEVGEAATPHEVGTTARIVSWDMPQQGVLLVTCRGEQRFRITTRQIHADRLQSARVQYLDPPDAATIPVPAAQAGVLPLLKAIVTDAGDELFPPPHAFDDAAWVARRFAEVLPIPALARQRLLELDDPLQALEIVQAYLRQHQLVG